jgi:hypothetical protein
VKPRLIYSMSVSVDGFIADREGAFGWSAAFADVWCALPKVVFSRTLDSAQKPDDRMRNVRGGAATG